MSEMTKGNAPEQASPAMHKDARHDDRFARAITFNLSNAEFQAMRRFARAAGVSPARYAHKALKAKMATEGKSND